MGDHSMTINQDLQLQNSEDYAREFEEPAEFEQLKKNANVDMECYQTMNICCGSVSGCLRAWLPCICFCLGKIYFISLAYYIAHHLNRLIKIFSFLKYYLFLKDKPFVEVP